MTKTPGPADPLLQSFRFRYWHTEDAQLHIEFDRAWVRLDDSSLQSLSPEQYMRRLMLVR